VKKQLVAFQDLTMQEFELLSTSHSEIRDLLNSLIERGDINYLGLSEIVKKAHLDIASWMCGTTKLIERQINLVESQAQMLKDLVVQSRDKVIERINLSDSGNCCSELLQGIGHLREDITRVQIGDSVLGIPEYLFMLNNVNFAHRRCL